MTSLHDKRLEEAKAIAGAVNALAKKLEPLFNRLADKLRSVHTVLTRNRKKGL